MDGIRDLGFGIRSLGISPKTETIKSQIPNPESSTVTPAMKHAIRLVPAATVLLLAVGVRGTDGPWREAALLSHGTAEQVYLLLRVALADQLTRPGEVCPLILDDPTPHFDATRTRAVLDLLLRISESRQVVMFSQELDVLAWAEEHLAGPRHGLIRLPGPR